MKPFHSPSKKFFPEVLWHSWAIFLGFHNFQDREKVHEVSPPNKAIQEQNPTPKASLPRIKVCPSHIHCQVDFAFSH